MKEQIINKVKTGEVIIGIIGLGYVGLPLAREFLKKDFRILGFDIDSDKVDKINCAESYIKHIPDDFLKEFVLDKKKLHATSDFSELEGVDFILICVPTPLDDHYSPDLSFVLNTTETIAKYLRNGHVIVLESTTYPGTTEEEMLPILEKTGKKVGKDFFLGYSPEREDPGNRNFYTGNIPKVISAVSAEGLEIVNALYAQITKTVPVSSPRVAESTKILENTYRAVNIALVNELKLVFDRMDIDIWEVIEAAKTKPFGFHAFYPGPGLGGHCIPIDPFYLTWKAKEFDIFTRFIELSGQINNSMPYHVVDKVMKALNSTGKSVVGSKILISGIAYKPDVDDMRESPALKVIDILRGEGADIDYFDPYIPRLPLTRKYQLDLHSIKINKIEKDYYDVIIIITDHSNVDYKNLAEKGKIVVDTRNSFKLKGIRNGKIWKA
jgi:UDP-N-acetyl-D-glucosamine dehydrogenase